MKPKSAYLPVDNVFPFSGLDTVSPPAQLAPSASPNTVNLTTFRGTIKKRTGYAQFGNTIGSETIVRLFEFQNLAGTNFLVAFTPTKQYYYNAGTWSDITGTTWTGTADNYVDVAVGDDINLGRVIVAVNGVDAPIYWTGTSTFANLTVNLTDFVTAKTVAIYNSYLVFANIKTTAGWEPQTAAWSDTGDFTEWLAGNSGVLAGMPFEGEILRMINFATNLIVFSRNTIGCLCYINSDVIFGSQVYASGTTLVSAAGVASIPPLIAFVGQDNVYVWDGGRNVQPIGDKIAKFYRTNQSSTYIGRTELFFDNILNQLRFKFQDTANSAKVLMCELNTGNGTFFDLQKSSHAGWFEEQYAVTPFTWSRYTLSSTQQRFAQLVFGSVSGYVGKEGGETADGGSSIDALWDTGDFVVPMVYKSQYARWLEIEFEALGSSVGVYYSVDQGANWVLASTVTLASTLASYKVNIDVTTRNLRVRFRTTSTTFELTWYRLWLRAGGAR